MNVNAPQQDSPSPHYTNFNSPLIHRRRATLPSVVISGGDAVAIRELVGWAKHDTNSTHPTDRNASHRTPTPLIGLALTSGANPNRRSRSAAALYDIAREQGQAEQRRRSAEVQYWSQSRVALGLEAVAVENQPEVIKSPESRADMDQGSVVSDHHSGTEISAALADAGSSIRDEPEIHTYDFGAAVHPSTEGMMGTSEAEAQPTTEDVAPGTVLDQRLSQIEDNMRALTSSIHELTGRAHRHTVVLESAPRGSRGGRAAEQKQQPPSPEQQQQQQTTSKDMYPQRTPSRRFQQPSPPSSGASIASAKGATHVPSEGYLFAPSVGTSGTGSGRTVTYQQESHFLSPESLSFSPELTTPELSTRERELQMQYAQYRPETSNIPPSLPSPSIYTHLAPLYAALRYERSQRKAMEARITQLSRQVSGLRATITNMRSAQELTGTQASRFSGYDDSGDETEPREEPMEMVTPVEEWTTPTQDWPGRSADPQLVHGGVGGAALGSPIEGEMF